jgi:prepilin-type N-terminal cleavage/methylation domain-containing protein
VEYNFMNVQKKNNEKGFTIIEVVLVLAIAGLIFLMVFIALPALQRNQRDTQRKQDLSLVTTSLTQYQSNNRNSLPADTSAAWNAFLTSYLTVGGSTFADPTEGNYTFAYRSDRSAPTELSNVIYVYGNSKCSNEKIVAAGTNNVAFALKLEGGGVACQNN